MRHILGLFSTTTDSPSFLSVWAMKCCIIFCIALIDYKLDLNHEQVSWELPSAIAHRQGSLRPSLPGYPPKIKTIIRSQSHPQIIIQSQPQIRTTSHQRNQHPLFPKKLKHRQIHINFENTQQLLLCLWILQWRHTRVSFTKEKNIDIALSIDSV